MPVNINGSTGVESPGYTQGGDPIVESGSNSDGRWTRWADGTQQVTGESATVTSAGSDSAGSFSFNYGSTGNLPLPLPFINDSFNATYSTKRGNRFPIPAWHSKTASSISIYLVLTAATDSAIVEYIATGRWK